MLIHHWIWNGNRAQGCWLEGISIFEPTCTWPCSPPCPSPVVSKCDPSASPWRTPPSNPASTRPSLTLRTSGCAGGVHSLHLNAGVNQCLLLHPSTHAQPLPCLKKKISLVDSIPFRQQQQQQWLWWWWWWRSWTSLEMVERFLPFAFLPISLKKI